MRDEAHEPTLGIEQIILGVELPSDEKVVEDEKNRSESNDADSPDGRDGWVAGAIHLVVLISGVER